MGGFASLDSLNWRSILEISIFWVGIYLILRSLRGTRGLGILKGGVGFVVGIYVLSKVLEQQFGIILSRLTFVIENLVTAMLIGFVVIFQPEVRRGLTRLGEKPFSWMSGRSASRSVSPIVEAAGRMSRRRIGALIVMERSIGIGTIVESGVPLVADVSAPLLESIFYPNAPLHDGAVVVRGPQVVAASCLLPLSDDPNLGPEVGTRHRAAVGLTEETDSLVIVVSEQTGRISVAFRGDLRAMRDTRELEQTINLILDGGRPEWSSVQRLSADEMAEMPRDDKTVFRSGTHGFSSSATQTQIHSPSASQAQTQKIPVDRDATVRTTSEPKQKAPEGKGDGS